MLSYKEYKLLNESLYGAFNLGLKSPNVVAGVVSSSSINGTEAALEAESEEALEEAKMKKKMDAEVVPAKLSKGHEDEHGEDEDHEDHEDEDEDEDEDHDDEEDDEDEDEDEDKDEEEAVEKKPMFMKKKAKKEWNEIVSDLESLLEDISDQNALSEIKKGLETIKEGMKKSKHKEDCGCPFCKKSEAKKDDKEDKEEGEDKEEESKGLSAAQKKLPKALQDAILAKKKGKKKDKKNCGKYMNEEEQAWWNSVNNMLGSDINPKNWDGGWSEVGEVQQAVREGVEPKKKVINESWPNDGGHYDADRNHGLDSGEEQSAKSFLQNLLKQTGEIWNKSERQVGRGNAPMMLVSVKDFENLMIQIDNHLELLR